MKNSIRISTKKGTLSTVYDGKTSKIVKLRGNFKDKAAKVSRLPHVVIDNSTKVVRMSIEFAKMGSSVTYKTFNIEK